MRITKKMKILSPLQKIENDFFKDKKIEVFIKRDDLIHPLISGNKWRKCFYLLEHLKKSGIKNVITFGGAYSNHIHAFSYAANELGLNAIGIIRGEELEQKPLNSTLSFAKDNNMKFLFVSREEYRKRDEKDYLEKLMKHHNAYIVPEGGTTQFAKYGLEDMVKEINQEVNFNYIMSACGTGGTIAGINYGISNEQKAIGISVLKGMKSELESKVESFSNSINCEIIEGYDFGGYAKSNIELLNFIKTFEKNTNIRLEQVYTGKMIYAFYDLFEKNKFESGSKIVLVHTGGLQGRSKDLDLIVPNKQKIINKKTC